ncbi:sulfotransferase family protein [Nostoc sp. UHCC 0870]|uniref:sulfotransferase family protein n=1 Tax=Nostoc sp. UHCC 0870 TaxID=2914041 RepID=UPI001EDE5C1C|nr:sulfotransferase [Nostoc sp. UHCC 0870]UKO98136.1 sulfotransferase [Nostoc sp. UHCC 0870]
MAKIETEAKRLVNTKSTPDTKHLDLLDKIDFNPVFIMAEHRSGTTVLYQTLVKTQSFNFIKAYHVIKYNEILSNYLNNKEDQACQDLLELLVSLGVKDRVIDNVEVTPNLPEEYGFILQNCGYQFHLNPDNLHIFKELCKKIQFISDTNRPLLLSNPWCYQHFMYVKSVFPQAKFIFIHRHPIHVINSKLKAERSMLSNRNEYANLVSNRYQDTFKNSFKRWYHQLLYSSYFDLGLRRFTRSAVTSTTYFLQNIDALSQTDYVSITYEELCNAPEITIFKILEFLGLEAKDTLDYKSLIQPRPLKLLPEIVRNYDEIREQLKPYFVYHKYV